MSVVGCPLRGGGHEVLGIQLAFSSDVVGDGNRFNEGSNPVMSGSLLLWRHFGQKNLPEGKDALSVYSEISMKVPICGGKKSQK